ncbi:MAG: hypothetical protein ACRD0F_05080, partial [Acidimicrobiales bacterium]
MELSDLLGVLRRYRLVAGAVFGVVVAVGVAAAVLPSPRYAATTTVAVQPSGPADFGSVSYAQFVMPTLAARVESHSFRTRVQSSALGPGAPPPAVRTGADSTTGIITITAESPDADTVAPFANGLAQALAADQPSPGPLVLTVLEAASRPDRPSWPARGPILLGAVV